MIGSIKKLFIKFKAAVKLEKRQDPKTKDDFVPSQLEIWRFIIKYIKVDWKLILAINLRLILSTFIQIRSPFVMLDIKNALIENNSSQTLQYILEYIFYKIVSSASNYLQHWFSSKCFEEIYTTSQQKILTHLLALDLQYFEENKVTQLNSLVNNGSNHISQEVHQNRLISQINHHINVFGRIYFIYTISANISYTMFCICFVFSVADHLFTRELNKREKEVDKNEEFEAFALDDIMNNISVIKQFGNEHKELNALSSLFKKNVNLSKTINKIKLFQNIMQNLKQDVVIVAVIFQIFLLRSNAPLEFKLVSNNLAELVAISFSMSFIINSAIDFITQNSNSYFDKKRKIIGRIIKLFNKTPSIPQNIDEDDTNMSKLTGDIEFENVCFKYPIIDDSMAKANQSLHQNDSSDSSQQSSQQNLDESPQASKTNNENEIKKEQQYTLNSVSFKIKQGQLVAFVGKSGSGKSTIAKIIQRCYDTNSGNVIFDGNNVKDFSIRKLKKSIGFVSQEPTLFDNDIESNITYGCQQGIYKEEDLRRACDISGVSEFVFDKKRFPKGLKTLIGSNGVKLSGGQKQRVALARALIKNPSILILDEATSSLDAESEFIVQKYIDELVEQRGMTIIVIAHRLSTIVKSDNIIVMEHGQIKEQGTHQELIKNNSTYKRLINRQMQTISETQS